MLLGIVGGAVYVTLDRQPTREVIAPAALLSPVASVSQRTTPTPQLAQVAATPAPPARILIPAAAVAANIVPVFLDGESWDVTRLGNNVGHLQGTAWFDTPGNIVLSGHVERSDGRRAVFASLTDLAVGDVVIVQYQGAERRYTVSEIRWVEPDDLTPLYPMEEDRLTLITCDSYDFVSDTYLRRTIVVAERLSG